jgi:hypothetical protein
MSALQTLNAPTPDMRARSFQSILPALLASVCLCVGSSHAQEGGNQIPQDKIEGLKTALTADKDATSDARKRLAVKRVIRDGGELLEAHPTAPNRFEVLGLLFNAQKQLFGMDDSPRNRESLLEICKQLAVAPDAYAELRIDAELLLSQTELARQGANAETRMAALKPMVARYRNTPAEAKILRIAMVMALEIGDAKLINDLREEMAERFAGDLEMINFQREKLGGQVFGAPFCGTFKRSDGTIAQFPADGLGQTTELYFWSQGAGGKNPDLEELAAQWKLKKDEVAGRLNIVSLNVDELPDAGEKILRDLGVDWPALHLPGGRDNPLYKTFAQRDPSLLTLSPTGYAALIMSGATRKLSGTETGARDYERWFNSSLARDWTRPRYVNQLVSLFAGDFLVVDPEGPFDPTLPPEIKALSGNPTPLKRTADSVPEETLRAIQDCFPNPPLRYRMPLEEIRANYQKAEELCAKAIAAHPEAPDLWIVRNRRIIAQLGLWKLTTDYAHYQRALEEAITVLDRGVMPPGTEVVARFCLAKESMREPDADPKKLIGNFVEAMGGKKAPGPALAAASLLALDVGDRGLHDEYRALILEHHLEHPMMWTFVSFLLDRYHRYWLFRVPFVAGWSFGRMQEWTLSLGHPDAVQRHIQTELETLEGKPFRLPEDCSGKWTVVLFTKSWVDDKKSPLPSTVTRYLNPFGEKRGLDDFQVIVAVLDGEVAPIQAFLKENPLDCQTLVVPGGVANPLVRQLGILDEDERPNALVLRPDGSIAVVLSGLTMSREKGELIPNLVEWHDEQAVQTLLESGEIENAKQLIFKLAPPYDPEAVDEKGRKLKEPVFGVAHVRARARVFMALNDWDAAQADALDEAEELLETIRKRQDEAKP